MTIRITKIIAALAGLLVASGASADPLTLEQALARALERSARLAQAQAQREVATARLEQARLWFRPELDIEAENVFGSGPYSSFDSAETTVALSQELPLGGARAADTRGSRAALDQADAELDLARIDIQRDVRVAFAETVAADRNAAIASSRARMTQEALEAVKKRFNAGLESELALARATVEASSAQAAARRAQTEAAAERRALASHWRDEIVSDALDERSFDDLAASRGETAALADHPRYRAAQLARAAAQARVDLERARRLPPITTTLGVRRIAEAGDENDNAFVLGLSLPLPFGNRNGDAIAEARAALLDAEVAEEAALRELKGERESATNELQAALLQARALAETGVPAAESAASLSAKGYDAGRISLLERLEAERDLFEIQEQLVSAKLAVQRARALLDSTRGLAGQ
jgi:outer membrane protein, heavy metal efflux system